MTGLLNACARRVLKLVAMSFCGSLSHIRVYVFRTIFIHEICYAIRTGLFNTIIQYAIYRGVVLVIGIPSNRMRACCLCQHVCVKLPSPFFTANYEQFEYTE